MWSSTGSDVPSPVASISRCRLYGGDTYVWWVVVTTVLQARAAMTKQTSAMNSSQLLKLAQTLVTRQVGGSRTLLPATTPVSHRPPGSAPPPPPPPTPLLCPCPLPQPLALSFCDPSPLRFPNPQQTQQCVCACTPLPHPSTRALTHALPGDLHRASLLHLLLAGCLSASLVASACLAVSHA